MKIALLIITVIVLLYWCRRSEVSLVQSSTDGQKFLVAAGYADSAEASNILARANRQLLSFLKHLKQKYPKAEGRSVGERVRVVTTILENYNFETIEENDPKYAGSETSYTLNKGTKMVLCLRDKKPPYRFCDEQVLMFCVLHEISHIGNIHWGHGKEFWTVFKFILMEASEFGIYKPIDYQRYPKMYCGMKLDYQPLLDPSLEILPL